MTQVHQLIRSRRRSLALVVTEEAKLVVCAPLRLPETDILRFINKKKAWIERKIAQAANRPKPRGLSGQERQALQTLAAQLLPGRVWHYAELTGLRPRSVKLSQAKKRWGSCNAQGDINLAWRLARAPLEVIDYVVVHELVHLIERNHAARFWRRVKEILPNYYVQLRWLKENGPTLL